MTAERLPVDVRGADLTELRLRVVVPGLDFTVLRVREPGLRYVPRCVRVLFEGRR